MNDDNQQHLYPGGQSLTDASDENGGKPKKQRKPSEMKRLKTSLQLLDGMGMTPQSLLFRPEGGFEIRFGAETNQGADEFEEWFAGEMKGSSK